MLLSLSIAVAAPTRIEARAQEVAAAIGEDPARVAHVLERSVAERVAAYPPELITPERVKRDIVDFEAFKLQTYATSGVVPKRYFGFLDGELDTAPEERVLRETTRACVEVINVWLAEQGSAMRITDQEVVVTFLAEGGALWLGDRDAFHPVIDVGLDDIASGWKDHADLVDALDARLGTTMSGLIHWGPRGMNAQQLQGRDGDRVPYLRREMNLQEAIAGTALMWAWEKDIAARKLKAAGEADLNGRSGDAQFIIGSLVYNSGDPHGPLRWAQIEAFDTAQVVWDKSEANATRRWKLPVLEPSRLFSALAAGAAYPDQGTDWLAMMHILQRYGAYEALERFTEHFDGGFFRASDASE